MTKFPCWTNDPVTKNPLVISVLLHTLLIEIGLRPGAADLGILGKFALSAQFCYIFPGCLHIKQIENKNREFYKRCKLVINHHLLRRKNPRCHNEKERKKLYRIHWSNLPKSRFSKIRKIRTLENREFRRNVNVF